MKKAAKIFAVILAAVMMLCVFTGCEDQQAKVAITIRGCSLILQMTFAAENILQTAMWPEEVPAILHGGGKGMIRMMCR